MLEIVILQRFSVIVIFILTASLLQIHTDLLNFGSAARPYSLDLFILPQSHSKNKRSHRIYKSFCSYISKPHSAYASWDISTNISHIPCNCN